jgi:hypothetical protein
MKPPFDRKRLRDELRDLVEVVLLPGLAAILPWRLTFRAFERLARCDWLYRQASKRALTEALARGWAGVPEQWLWRRKMTTLVDHADHYLARTRSDRWMDRYLDVQGQWPQPGQAALLLTFHWGAGMWALRHAKRAGLTGHMLVAPLQGAHFAGRSLLHRYIKARTNSIALALKAPFFDVANDMRALFKALNRNEQILAVIDVPADQVSASQPLTILGMQARVPTALLRLAVERSLPVYIYVTGVRMEDGRRFLRIRRASDDAGLDALVHDVFQQLEQVITEDPPAWHFWSEAQRFFRG